jgi:hypothetical protein
MTEAASLKSLRTAIPELLAEENELFKVQYGIREDDHAMVFHFFPPQKGWPDDISARLTSAMTEHLPSEHIRADYVTELDSFCIIYYGGGMIPAPYGVAKLFLAAVRGPQGESESGSETSP